MDRIGSDRISQRRCSGQNTVTTASPAAAPSPKNTIARFKALPHERKTLGWSREHGELTSRENGAGDGPKETRGSEWRWLGLRLAVTELSSTTTTTTRMRWVRLGSACDLYSPKALKNKESRDWESDTASVILESDDGVGLRKGARLTSGPAMSAMHREGNHDSACELGHRRLLGSAQAGERGKTGDGHACGSKRAAGDGGLRVSWAENREEKRIPFSFSFLNISKHF
jgi:hypothetical protein